MIELCNLCGQCNKNDELFFVLRKETASPRFKLFKILNDCTDISLYQQQLTGKIQLKCPAKIDVDKIIVKAREELVKKGTETEKNKKMMNNIRKYGNPYGDEDKPDKDTYI